MEVARPSLFRKSNAVSCAVRNTSCSRGWLRLLVQCIFATITVCSFILIVIMSVKNPHTRPPAKPTIPLRCKVQGCKVTCQEAPYYGEYEDEIIFVVAEAETQCSGVFLQLISPHFVNNTLPENWLSRMRNNIYQLAIISGNLEHIPSGAFMSQFTGNIEILVLQRLNIKVWESTSLVGLSSLRTLIILNSRMDCIHPQVLRAVDDTLESLTISESSEWDPTHFTGSRGFEKLDIVDFSYNNFNAVLSERSFYGLEVTKILYLNSCRITAIGAGTFDHLHNIEVLYLNDNMLTTVPSGLFNTIVGLESPRPRIHLQDNYWLCDCSVDDLRQLIRKELLLVEVTCMYPDEMNFKTFTEFEYYCNNQNTSSIYDHTNTSNKLQTFQYFGSSDPFNIDVKNCNNSALSKSVQLTSPMKYSKCLKKMLTVDNITDMHDRVFKQPAHNRSKWLQLSYFLQAEMFSVVQIRAGQEKRGFGLLWYQSACPYELYCLDNIPTLLRVFNIDSSARYSFCPIHLKSTKIEYDDCIEFTFNEKPSSYNEDTQAYRIILYLTTVLLCLSVGALFVYGLIRKKPTLLKGSKRILFVKHKNVDALVLPPKVPIRNDLTDDAIGFKDKEIFTLSTSHKLRPPNLKRMKSVKSDRSESPSYISAVQPTEDQLAEWRIRHHFNNDSTVRSVKSELSTLSWICDSYYTSLDDNEATYESLK